MSIFTSINESITGKDSHNSVKLLVWCYDFDTGKPVYLMVRAGSDSKEGVWGFTGGHIHVGECPFKGACREAKEEVGIDLNPSDCKHLFTIERSKGIGEIAIMEVQYKTPRIPPRIVQIKPDKGFKRPEIMEIRWISSIKDLNTLYEDDHFIPWDRELIRSRLKGEKQSRFEIEWKKQKEGRRDGYIFRNH